VTRLVVVARRGWFVDAIDTGFAPWELRGWLHRPEVVALLAQAPQAGRPLRGLLHALGMKLPDYLKRPRRKPDPRPKPPKPPRPPAGPPWSTRYPPPAGDLPPGVVWIAWRGMWLRESADKPPPVEYQ
jgi:hypothetical protein